MNANQDTIPTRKNNNSLQRCKFCAEPVNLDDEGMTYRDGSAAHEHCHDSNEFSRANECDFCD